MPNCLCFSVSIGTNCLMKCFVPRIGESVSKGKKRGPPSGRERCWLWHSSWRHIWVRDDDEVIEATMMDRRWRLGLGCGEAEQAPFGQALSPDGIHVWLGAAGGSAAIRAGN